MTENNERGALMSNAAVMEEAVLTALDGLESEGEKYDQRSVSLARTHIQTAFMWMNRAIFKPERLDLSKVNIPTAPANESS